MEPPYSHPPEGDRPGVLLRDHLEDVADRVAYVVPEDARTPAGESLHDVVETLAWVHDVGKATSYFQQYIDPEREPPDDPLRRHHAPIGAFVAYYALDVQGYDTETCLAGFVAVAKHHGRLPDVATYVHDRAHRRDGIESDDESHDEQRQLAIAAQIRDISETAPGLADEILASATRDSGTWQSFRDGYSDLLDAIESRVGIPGVMPGPDPNALSSTCFGLVLRCWSALVLADKTSAARAPSAAETYRARTPSFETLDAYVRDLETTASADPDGTRTERLNHWRSRARESALQGAATFAEGGGGVATLTLPTGMGKTLTGLSAALAVRDRLDGDRVVYALPFTSVIDQVVGEVEDIYEADTTGRLLTAHHHLAETTIRDESDVDEVDLNDDVAGILAESWRAGLTVTTFVQLFESLAGPANRQSMKLPALRDSVVVLDEPQSLPLDWWKLVPRLVEVLTEQYGASVVAMTATQPQLFDDATELVDDPAPYFDAVERVSYALHPSTTRYVEARADPLSYREAAADLRETVAGGTSALAICNTIESTRVLTERVQREEAQFVDVADAFAAELRESGAVDEVSPEVVAQRVESEGDRSILHLSTRLRPADRLTLVETAKQLTGDGHPLLAVSTQLVEAGVDISFDAVYRDLAPIDSIVQAAGRCNRSFESSRGDVTVWWLDAPGDQDKTPAEAVYNRGTSLLPVTADVLETIRDEPGPLTETAVARDAVERYYDRLHSEKNVGKAEYESYVDDAKAEQLGDLSLIDERLAADVLVCRTDADRELAESLRRAATNKNYEQLRSDNQESKPLTVSVPFDSPDSSAAEALQGLTTLVSDEGLYQLDVRDHAPYFDRTTGVVVPENTAGARLL